ncbi:unnamed protein product, partial [Ectocarpus sp. 4 AP-2014]
MFAVIFGAFGAGQIGSDATDASEGEQAAANLFASRTSRSTSTPSPRRELSRGGPRALWSSRTFSSPTPLGRKCRSGVTWSCAAGS